MNPIGVSVPKKDGPEKVSGAARYTMDDYSPDMLFAKTLTSSYAHAKIKSIDIEKARNMPGVKSILTGNDSTRLVGILLEDRPILARDKVRYYGEPVAVVVASSEAEAKKAIEEIEIQYEPLPIVNSPSQAFDADAPLVHENMSSYKILYDIVMPKPDTNIANHVKIRKGNMEIGWNDSEVIVEGIFTIPQSDHIALETRNVIAEITPDGRVIINTSSQGPFNVRKLISNYFGVPEGKVIVHTPYVGGAFGGKESADIEFIAYLATYAVGGKKIKLVNTREEDITSSPVKIGLDAKIKLGSTKTGELKAAEIIFLVDGGAYSHMAVKITKAMAADCTGPYNIENLWCDAYCMYTNHPYATSFRGFGHGELTFAIERAMDMLAEKLNMCPALVRQKNAIKPENYSPTKVKLTVSNSGDLIKCIEKVKSLINWDEGRIINLENGKVRTKGISCLWKAPSTPTDSTSSAIITFNPDGSVNLSIGSTEIGPGTKTTLAQILARKLNMEVDKVHVNMGVNTELNPVHWKTVASMTTFMIGRAVQEAAEDVIRQLKSIAGIVLKCPPMDLEVREGKVCLKDDPSFFISLTDIVYGHRYENGNSIGGQIIGHGSFIMRHLNTLDKNTGRGRSGSAWTVGAQAVEVEFNKTDYTYKILKAASVLDAGKVINPKAAKGVVMGGMNMGLSLATREELLFDDAGVIQNMRLRDYKIITFDENPDYIVEFVETPQIDAAYGTRGIGEHGLIGMPAALGNALSLAAGIDLNQLPLTPEMIWKAKGGAL